MRFVILSDSFFSWWPFIKSLSLLWLLNVIGEQWVVGWKVLVKMGYKVRDKTKWCKSHIGTSCCSSTYFLFFFFFLRNVVYLFIYFWLRWVFVSVRGLSPVAASGGHSSSRCAGPSPSRPLLLRSTGSRSAGSVIVAHGPSRSAAYGIFPDQGSNPCPLHWQADSQPLRHQGSPISSTYLYLDAFASLACWSLPTSYSFFKT